MSNVGEKEARTQKRVVDFFLNALGHSYPGFWKDRGGNSNVEEELLSEWLKRQGHTDSIIAKVLHEMSKVRALGGSKTLIRTPATIRCCAN